MNFKNFKKIKSLNKKKLIKSNNINIYHNIIHKLKKMNKIILITLFSLLTISYSNPLLQDSKSDLLTSIIKGFIEGLTKEGESGKCKSDIVKSKEKILQVFKELFKDIISGKDLLSSLYSAVTKLLNVDGVVTDCRLMNLLTVISEIITDDGRKEIIKRVSNNRELLKTYVYGFYNSVKNTKLEEASKYIGKAFQVVLNFYVN